MPRFLAPCFALVLAFALVACGGGGTGATDLAPLPPPDGGQLPPDGGQLPPDGGTPADSMSA